jgi:hypothetical protein
MERYGKQRWNSAQQFWERVAIPGFLMDFHDFLEEGMNIKKSAHEMLVLGGFYIEVSGRMWNTGQQPCWNYI